MSDIDCFQDAMPGEVFLGQELQLLVLTLA